jgi:hypothetical protein
MHEVSIREGMGSDNAITIIRFYQQLEDHDADDQAEHLRDALLFDMAIHLIDFKSHTHGGYWDQGWM